MASAVNGTMKAAQYSVNSQNVDDIKLVSVPKPTQKPGYTIVKINAASINPVDVKV